MGTRSPNGRTADERRRFVHTDVITAYSTWCSPSTPDDYVRALARPYPIGPDTDDQARPALAIADYGLHSAVKTAVACDRAGIDMSSVSGCVWCPSVPIGPGAREWAS